MNRTIIEIGLLLLSCDNPRLDPSLSEDESIVNMVKNQNDKLFELAFDIVEHGFNPLEIIGVYPSETYPGYYEVGEGNRRVCALKLLINPVRIQHINNNLFVKFQALAKEYSVPESIEVVVFDNQKEIEHWMEIRHMGEQGGRGLSKWNSVQKMRFEKSRTGKDELLDFWDLMIGKGILTEEEILSVTKTNWQRILREKYFPFLGIIYEEGYKIESGKLEKFTERIRAVQRKLSGQTVGIVYDQERIELFYNGIAIELYGVPYQHVVEQESDQYTIAQQECNENDGNPNEDVAEEPTDEVADVTETEVQPRDPFNGCLTVIPYSYRIRSSNMRLNKIINELKRLNPDDYPNASGALLRALFELSAKVFMEKETGFDQTTNEFQNVIKYAANSLRNQQRITNGQHSAIMQDVDNLRMMFNGYMHDTEGYPSGMALRNIFKAHRGFIAECLK